MTRRAAAWMQIVTLSGGSSPREAPDPRAAGVSLYRFRRDLQTIYRRTSGWHMDAMKLLLLINVAVFVAFTVAAVALPCVWPPATAGLARNETPGQTLPLR